MKNLKNIASQTEKIDEHPRSDTDKNYAPKYFAEAKEYSSSKFMLQLRNAVSSIENDNSSNSNPVCEYKLESESVCSKPIISTKEIDSKMADHLKAVYWLERTLEIDPQNEAAAKFLIWTLDKAKNYKKLHEVFMQLFPIHNTSPEFILSFVKFMVKDSPSKNEEEQNKSTLTFLNDCATKNIKLPLLEYYTATAYFNLRDYDKCCLHLGNFFKYIRDSKEAKCMIVFEVPKTDVPQIHKHKGALEINGDKIFIKVIGGNQERTIGYGPIIDSSNNSIIRVYKNAQ